MNEDAGGRPGIDELHNRIAELERQLASVSQRLVELEVRLAETGSPVDNTRQGAEETPWGNMSPALRQVVKLIQSGQGQEAQRQLKQLPTSELAEQPSVVALVAAMLCIERDDYPSALRALAKAEQFTQDERLLSVIRAVAARAG